MTNTDLLLARISEKGLKLGYVASMLGITRAGLYKKVHNQTQFTQRELYILCGMLEITTLDEIVAIFFNY